METNPTFHKYEKKKHNILKGYVYLSTENFA